MLNFKISIHSAKLKTYTVESKIKLAPSFSPLCFHHLLLLFKRLLSQGAWVAQLVKHLPSAHQLRS